MLYSDTLNQNPSFSQEFLPFWSRDCNYTLEVTKLIPENKLDFKATEDVMTFSEQILHIISNLASNDLKQFFYSRSNGRLEFS